MGLFFRDGRSTFINVLDLTQKINSTVLVRVSTIVLLYWIATLNVRDPVRCPRSYRKMNCVMAESTCLHSPHHVPLRSWTRRSYYAPKRDFVSTSRITLVFHAYLPPHHSEQVNLHSHTVRLRLGASDHELS